MRIVSNKAAGSASGSSCGARHTVSTVAFSQFEITDITDEDFGPALFEAGATNGYVSTCYTASDVFIFRIDSGGFTLGATVAGTSWQVGDVPAIRRSGGNVIVSIDGSDVLTYVDSTYTSVVPGLFSYGGGGRFINWTDGVGGGLVIALMADYYRRMRA